MIFVSNLLVAYSAFTTVVMFHKWYTHHPPSPTLRLYKFMGHYLAGNSTFTLPLFVTLPGEQSSRQYDSQE